MLTPLSCPPALLYPVDPTVLKCGGLTHTHLRYPCLTLASAVRAQDDRPEPSTQGKQALCCVNPAKRACYGNSEGQTDPKTFVVAEFFIKFHTNRPGKRSDSLGQKPPVFFQLSLSPNTAEGNYSHPLLLQCTRNEPRSGTSTPGLEPHHCPWLPLC